VVVTCKEEGLMVEDGNHRLEAIRRTGATTAWAVVGFEHEADRDRFVEASDGSPPAS